MIFVLKDRSVCVWGPTVGWRGGDAHTRVGCVRETRGGRRPPHEGAAARVCLEPADFACTPPSRAAGRMFVAPPVFLGPVRAPASVT